jgi:Uma2 family endonuclease
MAPQTSSRLTYEDYLELPDDGKHYELIEGELILNPAPVPRHQLIALNVAGELRTYRRQHGGGRAMGAPIDVVLAEDVVVQPDAIFIRTERMSIVSDKNIQGAPDLVVEVLSESTRRRDEIVKRKLYERYGVDEYWIVDPVLEVVKIYRRVGESFARAVEISTETGGTITSPLLPGFALDVSVVFDV